MSGLGAAVGVNSRPTTLSVRAPTKEELEKKVQETEGALMKAVKARIAATTGATNLKERLENTGQQVVHAAEAAGAAMASGVAEGYWGPDKVRVGPIRVDAGLGLLFTGYGFYKSMEGKGEGQHALALGTGFLGAGLAGYGREIGQKLRQKAAVPAQVVPAAPNPAPNPAPAPAPAAADTGTPAAGDDLGAEIRDILLTPETAGPEDRAYRKEERQEARQRRRQARRGGSNRFRHAEMI